MGLELRTDFLPERAWRGPELFLRAKNCTCVLGRGHPARGPSCPSGVPSSQACLDLGCRSSWGFPGGSDTKGSACNAGDLGLIPGSGRSPGEGNGNPLQYSCLENPMDRGACLVGYRHDSPRLCSTADLCPLPSLVLSSGSKGTTNLPPPSSVASQLLLSPLVH